MRNVFDTSFQLDSITTSPSHILYTEPFTSKQTPSPAFSTNEIGWIVVNSALVDDIFFYDEQISEKIAEAIILATESPDIKRDVLADLDERFMKELEILLDD